MADSSAVTSQPASTAPRTLPADSGRDLIALPKAHLHLHFVGSMRPSTLAELADRNGVRLPRALMDGAALQAPVDQRGWFRFQRLYDAARACVRTTADMERIVYEAVFDDAAEGSHRLEIQVDPTSYAHIAGGLTAALEVVLAAAKAAAESVGIEVGVIVATSRTKHPLDARTLARLAAQYAGSGNGDVIGFGLSNDERQGDTAQFAPAFRIAERAGLASLPHGGELLGPEHVRTVIDYLRPHRLGHGVRAAEHPQLLAELARRNIALEVCPASNVSLGVFASLHRVPLRALLAAGVDVALGADDPLLFGSRLVAQYETARHIHGLTDAELAELARGSVRASLAASATKQRLLAKIDQWLATEPSA